MCVRARGGGGVGLGGGKGSCVLVLFHYLNMSIYTENFTTKK